MILIKGLSFGYGMNLGQVKILDNFMQDDIVLYDLDTALCILDQPDIALLDKIKHTSIDLFLIIPPCSTYSHLASDIWQSRLPSLSIQDPGQLKNGMIVLADFDNGELLVAESEAESEQLQKKFIFYKSQQQSRLVSSHKSLPDNSTMQVLVEASNTEDLSQALQDGADGLSVIKIEQLLVNGKISNQKTKDLLEKISSNPKLHPFLIRFFDHELRPNTPYAPSKYLGYRGVRVLELDLHWLHHFIDLINIIDIDQSIIVFPMIVSANEIKEIRKELQQDRRKIGITLETPAAALNISSLLEVVDFIEIGLNDLTQYTMAWDRDIPNIQRLPPDHIAKPVADLITSVANACNEAQVFYTLGLDLKPNKNLAKQIMDCNVRSISCAPSLVGPWKRFFNE